MLEVLVGRLADL